MRARFTECTLYYPQPPRRSRFIPFASQLPLDGLQCASAPKSSMAGMGDTCPPRRPGGRFAFGRSSVRS
jgi:hypothetical protein